MTDSGIDPDSPRRRPLRSRRLMTGLFAVPAVAVVAAAVLLTQNVGRTDPTAADASTSRSPSAVAGPGGSAGPTATPAPKGSGAFGVAPSPSRSRSPQPPSGPPSTSGFPHAGNTGVPAGTALRDYTGSCTITQANVVITGKIFRCKVWIKAANVTIRKSKIIGVIATRAPASVRIEDSEVDGGRAYEAAVGYENVTLLRSDVHGSEATVNCHTNCHIQDNWIHGQYIPPGEDWHLNGYLSNGGHDVVVRHNTIACDAQQTSNSGGCTAAIAIFGDFAPNTRYTFDNNFLVASLDQPYCAYGGYDPPKRYGTQVSYIVFTRNVFERGSNGKCGYYGGVTSFLRSGEGNVWRDNIWSDGAPINP